METIGTIQAELLHIEGLSIDQICDKLTIIEYEINHKKNEYEMYKKYYEKLFINQFRNNNKSVWTISATPSKLGAFDKHDIGNFISYDTALSKLTFKSSFDYDYSCHWSYTIYEKPVSQLSDTEILNLNKISVEYPYF